MIEDKFLSKMKKAALTADVVPVVGVFGLSKTEVKKDVREMERSMPDDTDSDSSVRSEDVLPSSYPVKPRKTPKLLARDKSPSRNYHHDEAGEHEYDYRTVEETLCFIDAIKKSKKDLFNAECERERLESLQNVRIVLSVIKRNCTKSINLMNVFRFYSLIALQSKQYRSALAKTSVNRRIISEFCKEFLRGP